MLIITWMENRVSVRKKKERKNYPNIVYFKTSMDGRRIDWYTKSCKKNMLIKTPINQWPLQSYSVTLSQLILIKAEWSKPRKCYHHHPLLSIFFYFSGKKTKPKLLIDRRQGKQKHKMYMADSLYVRLLAKKYNSSPLLLFFFSVYFCTLFKQTKER